MLSMIQWILSLRYRRRLIQDSYTEVYMNCSIVFSYILTSKRNASFTFDAPYFLNSRLILFTEFTIVKSDIISNHKCKLFTFHADTRKVIGRFKLLRSFAMPVLVMDYTTKHRCIQSALLSYRKMNRRWCEIAIRSLQCKMFNSETLLGLENVSVTNRLGNSHYFVDKSECSEKLKAS